MSNDTVPGLAGPATRASRPRLASGILTFGFGMLLAAAGIVGVLIGAVQGPGWLIAAGIGALVIGLGTAFLGMVLLYRALVAPASGPRPPHGKK
jgi:hypothetical protein